MYRKDERKKYFEKKKTTNAHNSNLTNAKETDNRKVKHKEDSSKTVHRVRDIKENTNKSHTNVLMILIGLSIL